MSTTTRRTTRGLSTTDLALVATFAALIAVCAILPAISTGSGTPFTLQMFAIFLAGAVLGGVRGFLAVVLYLAVGTAGLPIFAQGAAGPATWAGVTGGYLLAFPLAALIVGLVAARLARAKPATFIVVVSVVAAIVTLAVVGTLGTLGMAAKLDVSLKVAWGYATPFFVYDIIKGVLAAIVAASVHRAFPQLTARR
ncbi:biotin transporter BioY [Aeromicrobium fastidiosum]|uniref:Biotin transporter n=1 Tax=Aeromicrobium fastidiosum TaxID=52699 RepID=A0A641ASV3_9ACTN|nr:biotin transporter BioY [Aeromicrobium fastidiosum]KAA1380742.1 biotin transporter BioY [Aeromicrobium fastidiosum]MBP2390361.1 biotin transport system substrate-specific component [Aeromicrobium fastidiosum]